MIWRRTAGSLTRGRIIGIPRALPYFIHPGLWEHFFTALGFEVLLSPPTTGRTVEQAALISESEHCLPVKLFDAHVAWFVGRADTVFVPCVQSTCKGFIACPKLSALPDSVRAQFGHDLTILTVHVNANKQPLARTLRALGRELQADRSRVDAAVSGALAVLQGELRANADRRGGDGGPRICVLSHPYNLYDAHISGLILSKLAALGATVELVDFSRHPDPSGSIKWDACNVMHETLKALTPATIAGVVQLTSFNCGCDSIVGNIFRDCLRGKGIPYLTLILDEHTAPAGTDTRLEAFLDSIIYRMR